MEFLSPPGSTLEATLSDIEWPAGFTVLGEERIQTIVKTSDNGSRAIGVGVNSTGTELLILTGTGRVMLYEALGWQLASGCQCYANDEGTEIIMGDSRCPASWLIDRARLLDLVIRFEAWQSLSR